MRTRWTRRLVGTAVLSAAVLATAVAADPAIPPAAAEKAIAADTAHLTKLFELAKTKKKLEGRVKATSMLIAAYAQDNMSGKDGAKMAGVRDQALKVAAAAAKKDLAAAADAAKTIGTGTGADKPVDLAKQNKFDLHELMDLFGGSVGGGMNIEKDIREAKKNGVTSAADAELIGIRTVAIADYALKLPPEFGGKKTKADWEKWTKLMKLTAIDVATEASKGDKADKAKLKTLMGKLDATCTNCHNTFRDD